MFLAGLPYCFLLHFVLPLLWLLAFYYKAVRSRHLSLAVSTSLVAKLVGKHVEEKVVTVTYKSRNGFASSHLAELFKDFTAPRLCFEII